MPELKIDHQVLREIVTENRLIGQTEWCFACGAGASRAMPEDMSSIMERGGQQFLDPKVLQEFARGLQEQGALAAWCFACGASKGASREDVVLPADLSDAYVDKLAQRLIGAVTVG